MHLSVLYLPFLSKNMRIILLFILTIFSLFGFFQSSFATCSTDTSSALEFIKGCSSWTQAVTIIESKEGIEGIKERVVSMAEKVIAFWALFAIGALVFSGIRYTTSFGNDETLKSAKNTAIYALVGLLLLTLAFPLVDIFVGFIYDIGSPK